MPHTRYAAFRRDGRPIWYPDILQLLYNTTDAHRLPFSSLYRLAAALLCLIGGGNALGDPHSWAQLNWENDIFANNDAGYTNGVGVSWGYNNVGDFTGDNTPDWIHGLTGNTYIATLPDRQRAISYHVAQLMFTPADIETTELLEDDRPYAGVLLWAGTLYAFDDQVADRLGLVLGVVGPASGAEKTQELVHSLVDARDPQGWGNQIGNELVFALRGERHWRLYSGHVGGIEFDWVGSLGASAGTYRSYIDSGIALRFGSRLASSWAAVSTIPSRTINTFAVGTLPSWQIYIALNGGYLFNDITLSGNTFKDSHSVAIIHEQAVLSTGVAINSGRWGLSLSYQHGSDQFEGQPVNTRFGSLALIYRYE